MKEDQIEAKLDQILDILGDLMKRIDSMKERDGKLSKRCDSIELNLHNKTENDKFTALSQKVENITKKL